jgi:hypothetical protein
LCKPLNKFKGIGWLIIYCFTSRSRIFHLYGHVTIAGERLQILGLCSALRALEQGGIFIVPHLLWHGTGFSSRLLRHAWGCGGSILTRILTGQVSDLSLDKTKLTEGFDNFQNGTLCVRNSEINLNLFKNLYYAFGVWIHRRIQGYLNRGEVQHLACRMRPEKPIPRVTVGVAR